MALQEVVTILGRAAANRQRLNELLDVLEEDYWRRRHPDDAWDVSGHVQHLTSIEGLITETMNEAVARGFAWICGSATANGLAEVREAARQSLSGLDPTALRTALAATRERTEGELILLDSVGLDAVVQFPPASEWAAPASVSIRGYLRSWAAHDLDHEQAIRDAITVQPGAADLASSLRIRSSRL